jgi:tetratricopeptide (TPR) repeat protein
VTTQAQRGARIALDAGRPAVARLDAARGPEDLAADLIDMWSAVEAALRSLVGSSALAGQALIREARQRQPIDFDLANSLAAFEAVHGRLQNTAYRPTPEDTNAARAAFLKLDAALMDDTSSFGPRPPAAAATAAPAAAAVAETADTPMATSAPAGGGAPRWLWPAVGALVIVLAVGGYFAFGRRGPSSLDQGVEAYTHGQREVAVSAFTRASREDPKSPLPHIWLARMAREVGNFPLASQELQLALQDDPANELALREMGANLLQQGNNDLARRFYVRAVQADTTDKTAEGYLGCALMRLGRTSEATTFINRAGPGPWSSCSPPAPTQLVPPGAAIPR